MHSLDQLVQRKGPGSQHFPAWVYASQLHAVLGIRASLPRWLQKNAEAGQLAVSENVIWIPDAGDYALSLRAALRLAESELEKTGAIACIEVVKSLRESQGAD